MNYREDYEYYGSFRKRVKLTKEALVDRPSFLQQVIRAGELAELRRLHRLEDELIFGAEMNPCIVLGEN